MIFIKVLTREDIGIYTCEKFQKGSPDISYKSSHVYLNISLVTEQKFSSPNLWLQLAGQGLSKSSFCIVGDSSISVLLTKNLIRIGLPPMVFTNISGINITRSPDILNA